MLFYNAASTSEDMQRQARWEDDDKSSIGKALKEGGQDPLERIISAFFWIRWLLSCSLTTLFQLQRLN